MLRLVHGIAAVDIAHSLGLPPATVRTRLSRGLQLLRNALPRGLATPALLAWLGDRALDHPVPHLDWTGAKVDDQGVARFRAAPPGRLRVELMTREQFADRDRDAAVPVGELAPGATSLHCTLPR